MTFRSRSRALVLRMLGIQERALVEPWDYVQSLVEQRLHEYLNVDGADIRGIVIVGAWRGREVARMLDRYPAARFVCFEPLDDEFAALSSRYRSERRVTCVHAAVSDFVGSARFYVPEVAGTGSLLQPAEGGRTPAKGSAEAEVTRLDDNSDVTALERVDCLWIDVQGGELQVLRGGARTLERTQTVFAEVAAGEAPYVGGANMVELDDELARLGFGRLALGLDPRNGEGNALWGRRFVRGSQPAHAAPAPTYSSSPSTSR